HRPRYDDWSFPKGKLDDGEDDATAALREVEEETGLRCHLGPIVGTVTYRDRRGRPKVVRYFQMDADGGAFAPNLEVDELRWVPVEDAARLLSYAHDRRLLRRVLGGTPAYALYVVRHAKAGVRAAWTAPDQERPLTRRGRKQARRFVGRGQQPAPPSRRALPGPGDRAHPLEPVPALHPDGRAPRRGSRTPGRGSPGVRGGGDSRQAAAAPVL